MKKTIQLLIFITLIFSCKSVDNWQDVPVLEIRTVEQAQIYIVQQKNYLKLMEERADIQVKDSMDDLDNLLKIEKEIALSSQRVLNTWFDFYLILRQDPGYYSAYRGHYYFRKGIDALAYSNKIYSLDSNLSLKESLLNNQILLLEGRCRLAIGEIVGYNSTDINTEEIYGELKKIYRSIK